VESIDSTGIAMEVELKFENIAEVEWNRNFQFQWRWNEIEAQVNGSGMESELIF
jgi:hypothetical protein